jgi:oligoribonuclease NrnB/cAMP/cGMP phosphodiesterase (DHH superfamily)
MSSATLVLYHGPDCPDGFGAAWAAWKSLGDAAVYVPVQYGEPYPPEIDGGVSRLFILDFSYPRATMERLRECAAELVCLDHHKTAEAELAGLPCARFDMDRSGAVLAWEYFHPGEPVPLLLCYVQDRDLWRWELDRSREFSAALAIDDRDFGRWDWLAGYVEIPSGFREFTDKGALLLKQQAAHVESLCSKAGTLAVGDHRVPAVNSPLFQSEIGEDLCVQFPAFPFAAVYSLKADGISAVVSLRSRNGFDVSAVAKSYGGGGHAAAAGFSVPILQLASMLDPE